MKVVVTGATGFIGKPLCRLLHLRGHEIVVLSRQGKAAEKIVGSGTAYSWDPEKEAAPSAALEGADAVIHLAGESVSKRWTESHKKRIYDSRIVGTRNLVDGLNAVQGKRPKALICASAIGYYPYSQDTTFDETSPPGDGFLSKVCRDWEKESARANVERKVTVRVGIVLGERGGALAKLMPLFRTGLGGPVGNGKQWMSWIHWEDMVSMFVCAVENEGIKGVMNGVAPVPVTNAEFSKALGRALHRPAILPAPPFALKLALGEMSELVLQSQRVVPRETSKMGFNFTYSHVQNALDAIVKKKAH